MIYEQYSGFIFDLDGTIYRGNSIIDGADLVVNKLSDLRKDILFVTNKTTNTVSYYANFLKEQGLNISAEQIICSADIIRHHLIETYPGKKFFAIGEKPFISQLDNHIVSFTDKIDEIDILIVTLDRNLTAEKIEIAVQALEKGAKFFAANIDDTCPVNGGEITDAGMVIADLEKRTSRKLEDHFGKPSGYMFNEIKRRLKYKPNEYLLVGDRLKTDIKMGVDFGIDTALVSTGVKNFEMENEFIKPKYKINSIKDLMK